MIARIGLFLMSLSVFTRMFSFAYEEDIRDNSFDIFAKVTFWVGLVLILIGGAYGS